MTFDERIFIPEPLSLRVRLRIRQSWAWGRTVGEVATEMYNAISEGTVGRVTVNFNGVEITMVPEEAD